MYEDTPCFGPYGSHNMLAAEVADSAVGFTRTGYGNSERERRELFLRLPIGKGEEENGAEEEGALSKMGISYNDEHGINANLLLEIIQDADINDCNQIVSSNWDDDSTTAFDIPRVFDSHDEVQDFKDAPLLLPKTPFPPTPAVFNHSTLQLQPQSVPFLSPSTGAIHDPVLDLNAHSGPHCPPPLSLMREMFQSLPLSGSALLGDGGEYGVDREVREGLGRIQNERALEFSGKRSGTKQHPTTERERRTHMKEKFTDLRLMIPNSTKTDKASVVGDAVEYIKELKRTADELKLLLEKKRCGRERRNSKRQKMGQDREDVGSCIGNKPASESNTSYSTGIRSSMLKRKSKATEVDVRVVDDEVTVKLVQCRKINCLLYVSRVLDEHQLDIQYATGGQIGDHYSFLFNSKIYEGSSVLAGAIASKLMESMDGHFSVAPPDH